MSLTGRTTSIEPLRWSRHGPGLFEVFSASSDDLWAYMTFGPFSSSEALRKTIDWMTTQADWLPYAILSQATHSGSPPISGSIRPRV